RARPGGSAVQCRRPAGGGLLGRRDRRAGDDGAGRRLGGVKLPSRRGARTQRERQKPIVTAASAGAAPGRESLLRLRLVRETTLATALAPLRRALTIRFNQGGRHAVVRRRFRNRSARGPQRGGPG